MTLEDMQDVLRRLAALADGWKAAGEVPPIERDLALDKLRRLYEALLTGAGMPEAPVVPGAEAAAEPEPVNISLDEVLSIEPVSAPGGPGVDAEAVLERERKEEMQAVASAPVPEVPAEVEPVTPVFAGEAASSVAPAAEPAEQKAEPAETPASEAEERSQTLSQPVFPTLFGLEETEEVRRRRHKQQVLMSLYDDEPRPARSFAAAPKPVDVEPVAAGASPFPPAGAGIPEGKGSSGDPKMPEPAGLPEENVQKNEDGALGTEEDDMVIEKIDLPSAESSAAGSDPAVKGSAAESGRPAFVVPDSVVVPETEAPVSAPAEGTVVIGEGGLSSAEPSAAGSDPGIKTPPAGAGENPFRGADRALVQEPGGNAVLGDVINHDVQTLADRLAAPRDRASEMARPEPVADLREAIGLNDKFLLIRDLFDGDGAVYDRAIEALNACADLDDCMIYIAEHYAWNPNSDGSKRMMELLERKFA